MFFRLQYLGCTDERFNHKNFGYQPVTLILEALRKYEEFKKQEINRLSHTQALGWNSLFGSFKGEGSRPSDFRDLLPFSKLAKGDDADSNKSPFTTETKGMIEELLEDGLIRGIPASIFRSVMDIESDE